VSAPTGDGERRFSAEATGRALMLFAAVLVLRTLDALQRPRATPS